MQEHYQLNNKDIKPNTEIYYDQIGALQLLIFRTIALLLGKSEQLHPAFTKQLEILAKDYKKRLERYQARDSSMGNTEFASYLRFVLACLETGYYEEIVKPMDLGRRNLESFTQLINKIAEQSPPTPEDPTN